MREHPHSSHSSTRRRSRASPRGAASAGTTTASELGRGSLEDHRLKGSFEPKCANSRSSTCPCCGERADRQPSMPHGLLDGCSRIASRVLPFVAARTPKIATILFPPPTPPHPSPPHPLTLPTPHPAEPAPGTEIGTHCRPGCQVPKSAHEDGRGGGGRSGGCRGFVEGGEEGLAEQDEADEGGRGAPSSAGSDARPTRARRRRRPWTRGLPTLRATREATSGHQGRGDLEAAREARASSAGSVCPRRASGPTVWITQRRADARRSHRLARRQPSGRVDARSARHSSRARARPRRGSPRRPRRHRAATSSLR